ncbi:MAG: efflux RND transporter periplasmic adaptor subunit [Pleurocapsa minor GSE-CHR-MK-17-07R]|jgi:HlyD family secretion protein|nr:efflux RND transporter periplasmic adaptor subunit [Pleurocapsa minor GSE-CHR-MK 17-07R]
MKVIRRLLFYVILLAGAGLLFLGARTFVFPPPDVQEDAADSRIVDETIVQREPLRVTVGATGLVQPARQLPLVFELPGTVSDIMFSEGDSVRAGDIIATLDTAELETALQTALLALQSQQITYDALTAPPRPEDIAVAQAAVDGARAALNAAYSTGTTTQQIDIASLQTELARNRLWQAQLQRDISASGTFGVDLSSLVPEGVDISQDIIDQANAALAGVLPQTGFGGTSATAGLNQAEFGVQIAESQANATANRAPNIGSVAQAQAALRTAQASLDRLLNGPNDIDIQMAVLGIQQAQVGVEQAQAALNRARIVAPFDGVIAQINLTEGEPPPSDLLSNPPVLLVDSTRLLIDVSVDETDIVDLQVGQPVELRFDALPDQTISGQVTRVNPVPLVVGSLVTYPVRVTLESTDAGVRLGMTATATVVVDELEDVLVLPNRFIRIDRATQDAFVTIEDANGAFQEVPITLGLRNETTSQIAEGLEEGDRVVLLPRGTFDPIANQTGQQPR